MRFQCKNAHAAGQVAVDIVAGATPNQFELTLSIPPDTKLTGPLELVFHVMPAPPAAHAKGFVLPLIPTSIITVPVPLPPLALRNRVTAEIIRVEATGWHDARAGLVLCSVNVKLIIEATEESGNADRSTSFRAVCAPNHQILSPTDAIEIAGAGTYSLSFALKVPLETSTSAAKQKTIPLEIELYPVRKADFLTCDPPIVRVKHPGVSVPAPETTIITPIVRRIGKPVWIDVVESVAVFDADVLFRIQGPIPHLAQLTLVSPGNVQQPIAPHDTQLHSGETMVPMRVVARLVPGKHERLDFSVVPPPATSALVCTVDGGFSLSVTAPLPARLAHMESAGAARSVHLSVPDNTQSIDVMLRPMLFGVDVRALKRLPSVRVVSSDAQTKVRAGTAAAGSLLPIRLQLSPVSGKSFFCDVDEHLSLSLRAKEPFAAVTPGALEIVVRRQAPFKRFLAYLAWATFPLAASTLKCNG